MKKLIFVQAAVLAAALLAPSGAPAATGQSERACVHLRNINNYTVIDDRHLVLTGGASRHYLVTTRTRCSGMRYGAQIATSFGETARLCPPIAEFIIPDDGWRCLIDTVEEVDSVDAARELIQTRAAAASRPR